MVIWKSRTYGFINPTTTGKDSKQCNGEAIQQILQQQQILNIYSKTH